jgi:hypothetical protein
VVIYREGSTDVSPSRPSFPLQFDVYPNEPHRLPSLPTTHYPPTTFLRPLFSYSYELLFPQVLSFDNHPRCPGVWGSLRFISPLVTRHFPKVWGLLAGSVSPCDSTYPLMARKSLRIIFLRTLWHSQKSQLLCNQANPGSFGKTPGVWGVSRIPNPSTGQTLGFPAVFLCGLCAVACPGLVGVADRIPAASLRAGRSARRGLRRRGAGRGRRRCSLGGGGRSAARRRSRGAAR